MIVESANGGLLPQNSNGPTHYGKHVDGTALRAMAFRCE